MSTPIFPFVSRVQAYVAMASSPNEMLERISVKSSIVHKGGEIVALGSVTHQLITIGDGIAMRYRLLPDGGRQIIMFLVPGDVCSINIFNALPSDHSVAAVTTVRVDRIDQEAMFDILKVMPSVNGALWRMADEQNALMRDHITRSGTLRLAPADRGASS